MTPLVNKSKKNKLKFNMLLDYCIGKAASSIEEFYLLPVGNKLIKYDTIAVNTIVKNKEGEVSSCDILYTDDLEKYNEDYYALQKDDLYTKANNYDRLGNFLINIHSLLSNQCEEMREFIDKVYEEKIRIKLENSEIETIPFYNEEKNKIENIPVYNSIKIVNGKIVFS